MFKTNPGCVDYMHKEAELWRKIKIIKEAKRNPEKRGSRNCAKVFAQVREAARQQPVSLKLLLGVIPQHGRRTPAHTRTHTNTPTHTHTHANAPHSNLPPVRDFSSAALIRALSSGCALRTSLLRRFLRSFLRRFLRHGGKKTPLILVRFRAPDAGQETSVRRLPEPPNPPSGSPCGCSPCVPSEPRARCLSGAPLSSFRESCNKKSRLWRHTM